MTIFVSGIGTGVGKTICSAIIVEALNADYWKPIQAGELKNSDSKKIKGLVSNTKTIIHPETYRLNTPASPHFAAELDGVEIEMDDFEIPKTENNLVIEGAGGLMVPINKDHLVIDMIGHLNCAVILVSQNYLGSINHTLLSIEAIESRDIPILGILFNGEQNPSTESIIDEMTDVEVIGRVNWTDKPDKTFIKQEAKRLKVRLKRSLDI